MYTTISNPIAPAVTTATRVARPGLLGGIGGLAFAGSVLVQNALRSKFPANDASAEEVMRVTRE